MEKVLKKETENVDFNSEKLINAILKEINITKEFDSTVAKSFN